jgi:hypothetical protein
MDEETLERTIRDLIERKNAVREGSAAERFYCRQLQALRYRYEEAGGLIEHYDPMGWGCYCRPLADTGAPSGSVLQLLRRPRT